jgi:hypothetical protein
LFFFVRYHLVLFASVEPRIWVHCVMGVMNHRGLLFSDPRAGSRILSGIEESLPMRMGDLSWLYDITRVEFAAEQ